MALLNAANHCHKVLCLSAFAVCVIEAIRGFLHILEQKQITEVLILPPGPWKVLLGAARLLSASPGTRSGAVRAPGQHSWSLTVVGWWKKN